MVEDVIIEEEGRLLETKVLESNNNLSPSEIVEFLEEGEVEESEFLDPRIHVVKKVKALLMFWQDLYTAVSQVREGYQLAKKFGDEEMKKRNIEQGGPLIKRLKIVEEELKEHLPFLKNVGFLQQNEAVSLPKWMHKLLGLDIQVTPPITNSKKRVKHK